MSEAIKTADVGTVDFDKLGRDDLAIDFMTKYEKGEVLSLQEYKKEVWDKENRKAHCNIMAYNAFFERAQHEVDMLSLIHI